MTRTRPDARSLRNRRLFAAAAALTLGLGALAARGAQPAQPLFPGHTLAGWQLLTTPKADFAQVCQFEPDDSLAVAGRPSGYFQTDKTYRNFTLHVEWRWPAQPGNGGILVHIVSGPKDRVWPEAYQIQLKHGEAGDILPMAEAGFATPLSTPPGARVPKRNHLMPDSELPSGEWNRCDITCRDDVIEVHINGVLQNRVTGCQFKEGRVGFQLEGAPFELRNVSLRPLD